MNVCLVFCVSLLQLYGGSDVTWSLHKRLQHEGLPQDSISVDFLCGQRDALKAYLEHKGPRSKLQEYVEKYDYMVDKKELIQKYHRPEPQVIDGVYMCPVGDKCGDGSNIGFVCLTCSHVAAHLEPSQDRSIVP